MIIDRCRLLIGACLIGGAILANALKPEKPALDASFTVDLAAIVPAEFGNWRVDAASLPVALPAELEEKQKRAYDQMLVRTYVNQLGQRIMLTIAFGGNQSKMLQVHRPEVCYDALGFQILSLEKVALPGVVGVEPIPAMRMVAAKGARNEPVTYWIRIGDQVARGNMEMGMARLRYGLSGRIVDGLLFRVSSITHSNEQGFTLQQSFVTNLMAHLDTGQRVALVGDRGRQTAAVPGA